MKAIRTILILVIVLTAYGCYSVKLSSYSPSILMEGTGRVKVDEFRYLPAEKGVLKNNQIDVRWGFSPIYSEIDIKNYVADAVSKELKFIWYKLDPNSAIIINGNIIEYSCDYIGGEFSPFTVKAKIEFVISNNENGKTKEIYRRVHEGIHITQKGITREYTLVVNEGLKKCIKSFVEDAQKKKILQS